MLHVVKITALDIFRKIIDNSVYLICNKMVKTFPKILDWIPMFGI